MQARNKILVSISSLPLTNFIKIAFGFCLLVGASKISVHIGPVPLTMQTCAIGFIGAFYGSRLGLATVLTFLLGALVGMPILATPLTGLAAFAGPTGGYLVSFPIGAFIAGVLAERGWTGTRFFASFLSQFACNIFIVIFGGIWLYALTGLATAFNAGIVPFVLPAVLKSILAAALLTAYALVRKSGN